MDKQPSRRFGNKFATALLRLLDAVALGWVYAHYSRYDPSKTVPLNVPILRTMMKLNFALRV